MKFVHIVAAVAWAFSAVAHAQSTADHAAHHAPAASAARGPATDGEVRKVDKAQGKLTLKHGPISNLDMPGMTMVFKASDPKLLEGLNPGDKVKFTADNVNGALTVTAIQIVE
jgi:Cu/Ag efflux protein CusF